MKVLGIAGSPRRGGNTDVLLAEFLRGAASKGAEVKAVIALNELQFIPCQHCDACLKTGKCKYQDDMQMVYRELEDSDRIVLASPIHFSGVSAQLKAMIDRCQALWARRYVLIRPPLGDRRERKGFLIAVGGRGKSEFEPARVTVKTLFVVLDIAYAGELLFQGIDRKGEISEHPDALRQAFEAGQKFVTDPSYNRP